LERVKAEREKQAGKRADLETELREQLAAAQQASEQKDASLKEKNAEFKRLEQDVVNLRRERQELHGKCIAEKQAGAKSKRRIKELEKQLREIASGFATAEKELGKRASDRALLENEIEAQLAAAKEAAQQAEAAHRQETARCTQLEDELTKLRDTREELNAQLAAERQKAADSAQHIETLEKRVREGAAELARAKAAANAPSVEPLRAQTIALADNAEGLLNDVCRLRENEAAYTAEISELERRVRDGVASLARVTAELENERSERRRVEQRVASLTQQLEELHVDFKQHLETERNTQARVSEIEEQVRERERIIRRLMADLQKETANRELAEQQLQSVGDMGAQLRQYLALFEDSKKVFKRTQEQLEARLKSAQDTLTETEARLQKEIAERRTVEASLTTAQRSLNEQSEEKLLELSRLKSDLQVEQLERKRLEGDAQQSRYASLDSARVARAMVNSLRRQVQDAVENLMQATRRLLEITSEAEQKELVQSVLENALLLQTNLQESGPIDAGLGRATDSDLRSAA
jgi:chromosome segregation ATPase